VGFDFASREGGKSKASLREGLIFLRHLGCLAAVDRGSARAPDPATLAALRPARGGS
jgi:hypothetical protein